MSRRTLVIALLALLAAAVIVPITFLALTRPTAEAPEVEVSDDPPVAVEPIRADDVAWAFAAPLFGGPANTYTLQAGLLGQPEPAIDLEIPFGVDPNNAAWRRPAVGLVVDGSVIHVADDGNRSSLRRIAIGPNPQPDELAVLDEIVYSLAVTPDGNHAYLALGDRADHERDRGIVRVSLDGQGRLERIFDPVPGANREPTFSLAAVVGFHVDISLSVDARHLIRYACAGLEGCTQQVIDVESGAMTPLGDRRVLGAAGGLVLAQRCGVECVLELIDLASGAVQRLPEAQWDSTMALLEGRPRVAYVDTTAGREVLRAVDPRDGSAVDIFRAPPGKALTLSVVSPDVRIALPAGYVLISVSGDDIGAIVDLRSVAIPLDGGQPVELPMPPFRPEFRGVQG